jgi:hypothetical protein
VYIKPIDPTILTPKYCIPLNAARSFVNHNKHLLPSIEKYHEIFEEGLNSCYEWKDKDVLCYYLMIARIMITDL